MDNRKLDPSQPLRDTEERPIGVAVPVPLSRRLDLLVRRAEAAGARAFRKDLVAALILAAPEEPEELLELFLRYRKATAADAAIEQDAADVLQLDRAKPGRRPRPT